MANRVTLRDTHDVGGRRRLTARLEEDGTLIIDGQDLGPGVERFFGPGMTEYEWAWTIRPQGVKTLKQALSCSDNVLVALRARFSGDAASGIQPFLNENGIPYEPWSRVGD